MNRPYSKAIDVILILLFFLIPIFGSPDFQFDLHLFKIPPFQKSLFSSLMLLGFYFINSRFLLPELYLKQRFFLYISALVVSFLIIVFLPEFIFQPFDINNDFHNHAPPNNLNIPPPPHRNDGFVEHHLVLKFAQLLFQFLFVIFLSFSIKSNEVYQKMQEKKNEIALNQLTYELYPHFLFNCINNAYSLSIRNSPVAPQYILKISELFRNMIDFSGKNKISVRQEIDFLKKYIELQKLGMNVSVDFHTNELILKEQISPLILINLVENAFKYCYTENNEGKILLNFYLSDDLLCFDIKNSIKNSTTISTDYSVGLKNLTKRLEVFYLENYSLQSDVNNDFYCILLKIKR